MPALPRCSTLWKVIIDEGKTYQAGTSLHVKAGKAHGPHSTQNGCTLLVLWTDKAATQDANLGDFMLAQTVAAA
jgi:hypothetical protein